MQTMLEYDITQTTGFTSTMFDPQFVTMDWSGVVAGLFLGMILLSCIYSSAFFTVLKQPFLLWYAARGTAIAVLTLTLSPLELGSFLPTGGQARTILGFLGFDLAVALSGPFIVAYLERGILPKKLSKALFWSFPVAALFIPVYWISDPPTAYYVGRLIVYLGILILLISALVIGWRVGSRTARFQTLAWAPVLGLNTINLPHHIAIGDPMPYYLALLFGALAIEFLVTALGIADRFMTLKRERDRAKDRENVLLTLSETDPLTGLANRRGLERGFSPEVTALALFDLDHFKKINDVHGHDIGDEVLVHAAKSISTPSAMAARLGGEEFAVLFCGRKAAQDAENLRRKIASEISKVHPDIKVTSSAGLAFRRAGTDLSDMLKEADELLYRAKNSGRDRLFVHGGRFTDFRLKNTHKNAA